MMERFAQIQRTGGPEVIEWADVPLTEPAPGEVRMRNLAVGLNFIDTYHRSGLYPMAKPCGLGMEAAGIIEAVGDSVSDWQVGDRVATFGPTIGAYCTARNIAANSLFRVPDDISHEVAAAGLLKGCTTEFLVERCAKVQPQWDVLVHAAAGGVGLLLVQWLKHVGARVIGTVSTDEKAALARAAGASAPKNSAGGAGRQPPPPTPRATRGPPSFAPSFTAGSRPAASSSRGAET